MLVATASSNASCSVDPRSSLELSNMSSLPMRVFAPGSRLWKRRSDLRHCLPRDHVDVHSGRGLATGSLSRLLEYRVSIESSTVPQATEQVSSRQKLPSRPYSALHLCSARFLWCPYQTTCPGHHRSQSTAEVRASKATLLIPNKKPEHSSGTTRSLNQEVQSAVYKIQKSSSSMRPWSDQPDPKRPQRDSSDCGDFTPEMPPFLAPLYVEMLKVGPLSAMGVPLAAMGLLCGDFAAKVEPPRELRAMQSAKNASKTA